LTTIIYETPSINLGQEDQSQEIFLSINATGRQLSEFDYLRNYIFLRTKEKEKRDALYEEHWSKFEKDPWTVEKLDEFFHVFLMAKLGPRVFHNNIKLFDLYQKEYREKLPKGERNAKYELNQLELYAETYIDLGDPDSRMGSQMQFYKDLGTYEEEDSYNSRVGSQHNRNIICVQSFILHLKNELKRPYEELYTVFEILESYVARRLLVDTVDSRYAYETIEIFFREIVNGSRQFSLENLVQYLNSVGRRKWISNNEVFRRFQESGNREQGAGRRFQGSLLFTERYILYRIENWKRLEAGELPLRFEEFYSTQERMLNSRILRREAWARLGNATFRTSDIVRPTIDSFEQEREFLNAPGNQILLLNREICQNDNWKEREINDRQRDLLSCFYKIWKPAEEFTRTAGQHARTTSGRFSESKRWVSVIQSNAYQPVRFDTSDGIKLLAQTKVLQNQVKGIDKSENEQKFHKSDILFVCSGAAWDNLRYHVPVRTSTQFPKLTRQLQVNSAILKLAQDHEFSIAAVTHLGRKLTGRIDDFDDDAIYLQIEGHEVIVFRSALLEVAIEKLSGFVKKWRTDDLFGYIEPSAISPGLPQEIMVKSASLDPTIVSGKLLPEMKVEFDLEIVQKEEHSYFQASNVRVFTIGQLYQGEVKWFNPVKGSGFLISTDYPDEIYIHKSQMVRSKDINSLREGYPVEFEVAETVEGQNSVAINIKIKRSKR
jgi:CspA family cold shock protein